jgi:hypothetical protein
MWTSTSKVIQSNEVQKEKIQLDLDFPKSITTSRWAGHATGQNVVRPTEQTANAPVCFGMMHTISVVNFIHPGSRTRVLGGWSSTIMFTILSTFQQDDDCANSRLLIGGSFDRMSARVEVEEFYFPSFICCKDSRKQGAEARKQRAGNCTARTA